MSTHYIKRTRLLKRKIPALFIPPYPLRILYVGGKPKRIQCVPELYKVGHRITLLELVPEFAKALEGKFFEKVIVGDVSKIGSPSAPQFDVTFWWHGPEHLGMEKSIEVIQNLERLTRYLVVLASPYGHTKLHGYKYPGQVHVSVWLPKDYTRMGYEVVVLGKKDSGMKSKSSHIMGWKWLKSLPLPEPTTD